MLRWRFQNSPLRSLSRSSGSGRWRWMRLRPKRQAMSTMPPNEDNLLAPPGVMQSCSDCVCSGLLISNASSEDGKLVIMSFSSIVMGQPVPMLAYRSSQNAIQKVRLLSSRSVQSRGGGRDCLTSRPAPSSRWRPILSRVSTWAARKHPSRALLARSTISNTYI